MALAFSKQSHLELTIDKLGRVVIPQEVRSALNLQPGSKLKIHLETQDKIILKVVSEEPVTKRNDGVLVIGGKLDKKQEQDFVRDDREGRLRQFLK